MDITIEELPKHTPVDVGSHFVTSTIFYSREELIEWVRNIGQRLGFVIIIQRADPLTYRTKPRVKLGCDRGGFPRASQNKNGWVKKNLRKSWSKRCGCPFSLQGQKFPGVNEWTLELKCGLHNHEFVYLEAHSSAGKLDIDGQRIIEDMYVEGVKPRKIMSALKNRDASSSTCMRTIYNEKSKLYRKELAGGTLMQFLYKCIDQAGYVSYKKVNAITSHLESLFFAHPVSVQLSNMFPDMFIMDCTYKTNRYRLPLLSIVGQTSTNLTFFSAFTFISDETESSYAWALECFKNTLKQSSQPNVLIVDREITLMNAIKDVFPQCKIVLCQLHIHRNILAHCKKYFEKGKECEDFLYDWQQIVNSPTVHDFNMLFNSMVSKYSETYPDVLHYVVTTWVDPYKELFVSAWIDKYMHLGNSTTNRVERGHNQLKRFLEVSIGNLTSVWKCFNQMINLQHTEIKRTFGQSSIQGVNEFRGSLYTELLGSISLAAMEAIRKEEELVKSGCPDVVQCLHKTRFTMGLPCAHELVNYIKNSSAFPLWMIHKHWKQLQLQSTSQDLPNVKEEEEPVNDIKILLEGILEKYNKIPDIQKNELKRKLCELMDLTTSQTFEPLVSRKLKGRPQRSTKKYDADYKSTKRELSLFEHVLLKDQQPLKKKKSRRRIARKCYASNNFLNSIREEMPPYISNYIVNAINVLGDGHCGYRVICLALDKGENWLQVREELSLELHNHENLYTSIYGIERKQELLLSLDCNLVPAPFEKWMTMPDMGLLIASCYNVALVHYSRFQSFTFLPLHSAPPEVQKIIYIGFVNENHFIQLLMDENCPLPPIISIWQRYHDSVAEAWDIPYIPRFRATQCTKLAGSIVNLGDR